MGKTASIVCTKKLVPRERFEEARKRGYLVDRARTRVNLSNAWWFYCESADRPYVVVRKAPGRRRSTITCDLGTVRGVFTPDTVETLRALFVEHADTQSILFSGRHRVALYGLPTDVIEMLAPSIYRLVLRGVVLEERPGRQDEVEVQRS